jgi:hypothetical protein
MKRIKLPGHLDQGVFDKYILIGRFMEIRFTDIYGGAQAHTGARLILIVGLMIMASDSRNPPITA